MKTQYKSNLKVSECFLRPIMYSRDVGWRGRNCMPRWLMRRPPRGFQQNTSHLPAWRAEPLNSLWIILVKDMSRKGCYFLMSVITIFITLHRSFKAKLIKLTEEIKFSLSNYLVTVCEKKKLRWPQLLPHLKRHALQTYFDGWNLKKGRNDVGQNAI